MTHLDEYTGLLYLDGQLERDEARDWRSHAAACAACRSLLQSLERESILLRTSLQQDTEPLPTALLEAPPLGAEDAVVHFDAASNASAEPVGSAGWFESAAASGSAAALGFAGAFALAAGGADTAWNAWLAPGAAAAGLSQRSLLMTLFFNAAFWEGWSAMVEIAAIGGLGALLLIGLWLLGRRARRIAAMGAGICTVAVAFSLAFAAPAQAAEVERGNPEYTLPAGQEVKTDLIVFSRMARIDGDVDGDLIVFSATTTVNGHVKGDVIAFDRDLGLHGTVDGNVRTFGQMLTADAAIGKNLTAFANQLVIDDKATIGGTMTVFSQALDLRGRSGGDLLAFAASTEIDGVIGGDARIHSGRLSIGPKAEIHGATEFISRQRADISPSAKLFGTFKATAPQERHRIRSFWRRTWGQILKWGASFVFGMVVLALMPKFWAEVSSTTTGAAGRILPAIGIGALFLFATPIIAVIVCITIVGLGVGLSMLLLWGIALYAAHVFIGAWIGGRVLSRETGLGALALGLLILQIVELLPFAGGWISFLVILWGFGALALGVYSRFQGRKPPALTPVTQG